MINIRLFWVCFNPFFKRLFYFEPIIYALISITAVFTSLSLKISLRGLIFTSIVCLYLSYLNYELLLMYFPPLLILLFKPTFTKMDFYSILQKFQPILALILVYSLVHKLFGYTFIELNWIYSGLGTVNVEGYFVREDIRPISFLAGTPELTLLYSIYSFYYLKQKNFVLSIFMIFSSFYLAGSRGVIVSLLIALFVLWLSKDGRKVSFRWALFLSVFFNILTYFLLVISGPFLLAISSDSRMFVYGTFNARFEMLVAFYLKHKDTFFLIPSPDIEVYDNSVLTLTSHFTILSNVFLVFVALKFVKTERQLFSLSILLGYALYADVIMGYYFLFLIGVMYFAKERYNHTT